MDLLTASERSWSPRQSRPLPVLGQARAGRLRREADKFANPSRVALLNDYSAFWRGDSLAGDLTDETTFEHSVQQRFRLDGRAGVLVNNAGVSLIAPAEPTTVGDDRRELK